METESTSRRKKKKIKDQDEKKQNVWLINSIAFKN